MSKTKTFSTRNVLNQNRNHHSSSKKSVLDPILHSNTNVLQSINDAGHEPLLQFRPSLDTPLAFSFPDTKGGATFNTAPHGVVVPVSMIRSGLVQIPEFLTQQLLACVLAVSVAF